jgi:putative heme transporter
MALYFMIERDRLRGGLFSLVPRCHHVRLSRILLNLETIVGAYIRGQLLTSSLIAVFTFTLLTLVGAENAIFFALIAGVADVLPYLGVLLSVGPAVFAALPRGFSATIIVLIAMLAYEEFESRILIPHVYGKQLRLPASIVLFSLLIGGILMGAAGAVLSLPMAATIMMLIEELRVQLPGENEPMVKEKLREEDDRAEKEYERQTVGITTEKSAAIAVKIAEEKLKDESVSNLKNGGHP